MQTLKINSNEKKQEETSSITTEMIYANDCDFMTEDKSRFEVLKEIVKDCLGRLNLKVKAGETIIKRDRAKTKIGDGLKTWKFDW